MIDSAVSLPVFGFSDGMFSMCTLSNPNSPSTVMSWQFLLSAGSAAMRTIVRSGPMPARLTAADTFRLEGKTPASLSRRAEEYFLLFFQPVDANLVLDQVRRSLQRRHGLARHHLNPVDSPLAS